MTANPPKTLLIFLLSSHLTALPAAANPTGGVVVGGSAEIVETSPTRVDVVQTSDRAVIDWTGFDIAGDEHTNFQQPSSSAVALNRVTAGGASSIEGALTANGNLVLVNPNGIFFGPGAQVDVGGLVATTADVANEDFMASRLEFSTPGSPDAAIVNEGTITAAEGGLVAFVAPNVRNSGVINARLGRVTLASGDTFTLDLYGDGLVEVATTEEIAEGLADEELTRELSNAGAISADGGRVVMVSAAAASDVVDRVINMDGIVEARTVEEHAGRIVLRGPGATVHVAGTLDASGRGAEAPGGSILVTGEDVAVGAEAALLVDAGERGDGGEAIVFGDRSAEFAGLASARGGRLGGNAGFVEVSGVEALGFSGTADLAAPNGAGGTLLLDPTSAVIGDATIREPGSPIGGAGPMLSANSIGNALATGAEKVRVEAENITVQNRIDGRGGVQGNALELAATESVAINSDILTNDGDVTVTAQNGGVTMSGTQGGIAPDGGTLIDAGTGNITLRGRQNVDVQHLQTTGAMVIESEEGTAFLRKPLAPGGGLTASGATTDVDGTIVSGGPVSLGRDGGDTHLRRSIFTDGQDVTFAGRAIVDPAGDETTTTFQDGVNSQGQAVQLTVLHTQVTVDTGDGAGDITFRGQVDVDPSLKEEVFVRPNVETIQKLANLGLDAGTGGIVFEGGVSDGNGNVFDGSMPGDRIPNEGVNTLGVFAQGAAGVTAGETLYVNNLTPGGLDVMGDVEFVANRGAETGANPITPTPANQTPASAPGSLGIVLPPLPGAAGPGAATGEAAFSVAAGPPGLTVNDQTQAGVIQRGPSDRSDPQELVEDGEQTVARGCPSFDEPIVFQTTPAQAAFSDDPRGNAFSVDVFCGDYEIVEVEEGAREGHQLLSAANEDFWTDLEQARTPGPLPVLMPSYGLRPAVAAEPPVDGAPE